MPSWTAPSGKRWTAGFYDTGITGEVMGEPTDPFMAIDVTEDGCLLYQMGIILLERA